MNHSLDYWRGVTAAYDALYEGKETPITSADSSLDFDSGVLAQVKAFPVKILVPAEMQPRPTNFGCAVLSGLAVTLFLFLILGWPKLPAPAKGGLTVATVVCFLGAWRNLKP